MKNITKVIDYSKLKNTEREAIIKEANKKIKEIDKTMTSMLNLTISKKKEQIKLIRILCTHKEVEKRDITGKRKDLVGLPLSDTKIYQYKCLKCGLKAYSDSKDVPSYWLLIDSYTNNTENKVDCKHNNVIKEVRRNANGTFTNYKCKDCHVHGYQSPNLETNANYRVLEAAYFKQMEIHTAQKPISVPKLPKTFNAQKDEQEFKQNLETIMSTLDLSPNKPKKSQISSQPQVESILDKDVAGTYKSTLTKQGTVSLHPAIRHFLSIDPDEELSIIVKADGSIVISKLKLKGVH